MRHILTTIHKESETKNRVMSKCLLKLELQFFPVLTLKFNTDF